MVTLEAPVANFHYRTTYLNPLKSHSPASLITAGVDVARLRSAAKEHAEMARHARQRGDHIAAAYHQSCHEYLSTAKGKAATILAARTGIGIGSQAGEHFGLNISKGWSPTKHTNTYRVSASVKKKETTGHGGGRQHRKSNGQFG